MLRRLHIHPVGTPTDASWLNAIEARFGVTKRATLTGSGGRDHVPAASASIATAATATAKPARRIIP